MRHNADTETSGVMQGGDYDDESSDCYLCMIRRVLSLLVMLNTNRGVTQRVLMFTKMELGGKIPLPHIM
jgi:hypothetical protein